MSGPTPLPSPPITSPIGPVRGRRYIVSPSMSAHTNQTPRAFSSSIVLERLVTRAIFVKFAAPAELLASGMGDVLGKYVALADWQIANLLTGECYCGDMDADPQSTSAYATTSASHGKEFSGKSPYGVWGALGSIEGGESLNN